ncbi:hypothetical protein IF1G_00025 [Cordyceps javanica]|uniref:Uncharacterized protein n=1 Tax=Cordyceps javanica TaxID=43265 RepID=A0A545VEE3_9HYPO|nr:hypothetical protein IF1G_00025 [Cordyceps javanica]TQW11291.1 hypothetical protein IF2G_00022 [Cordyceps javanica]
MKASAAVAILAAVTSAESSTTFRTSFIATQASSQLPDLPPSFHGHPTNTSSHLPGASIIVSRGSGGSSTAVDGVLDPTSTTGYRRRSVARESFIQFPSTTRKPTVTTTPTPSCTFRLDEYPTTFQQFSSSSRRRAKPSQKPPKPGRIPDPFCAHPQRITIPPPSMLDPFSAHPARITVTDTTAAQTTRSA